MLAAPVVDVAVNLFAAASVLVPVLALPFFLVSLYTTVLTLIESGLFLIGINRIISYRPRSVKRGRHNDRITSDDDVLPCHARDDVFMLGVPALCLELLSCLHLVLSPTPVQQGLSLVCDNFIRGVELAQREEDMLR